MYCLCCSMYCLFCVILCIVCFVSFCVLFVLCHSVYCLFCVILCIVCVYTCTVLLPPGGYPIAVKYIIYVITYLYIISYIISHLQKNRNLSESAWSQRSIDDSLVPISCFYVYSFCKVQHPITISLVLQVIIWP